jgi:hypothetical protein
LISAIFLISNCHNTEIRFPDLEKLLDEYVDIKEYSAIYVFDEYSCGICSDNILESINSRKSDEFIVLYSQENHTEYKYEDSILTGYVSESKIIPVSTGVIETLRSVTETYKGNYELQIIKKSILSIKNH